MRFIGDISYAARFYCTTVSPRAVRALAYLAHWMPKYIGGKYAFYHAGILSALSSYIFPPRAAMKSFSRRDPRGASFLAPRRGIQRPPRRRRSRERRLKSPVLIRGNFYTRSYITRLSKLSRLSGAERRAALHPQLTGVYQPSCLQASSPLPRGMWRPSILIVAVEIWLRISVKCRRGYAVRSWEKVPFNLLLRCAIPKWFTPFVKQYAKRT